MSRAITITKIGDTTVVKVVDNGKTTITNINTNRTLEITDFGVKIVPSFIETNLNNFEIKLTELTNNGIDFSAVTTPEELINKLAVEKVFKTASGSSEAFQPIQKEYADITLLLSSQATQTTGYLQYVKDATIDTNVLSGGAYYEYLGTVIGNLTDYRLLTNKEALVVNNNITRLSQLINDVPYATESQIPTPFLKTDAWNGELQAPAYPNTRNDGQLSSNRILSTDASGNLRLYTTATAPAPFLENLIPDSNLPSTTGNFIMKGSFFTPDMCLSANLNNTNGILFEGQTINYATFVSDNQIDVNVTTGAAEGNFNITLNNGLQAIFSDVLLIITGTIFTPTATEMTVISGTVDLTEAGAIKKNTSTSDAIVEIDGYNIPLGKDFQLRFKGTPSPLLTYTYTNGEVYVDIIENGLTRYSVKWWYTPSKIRAYQVSTGLIHPYQISDTVTSLESGDIFYFQRIGTQMVFKRGATVLATFTDLSDQGIIKFSIRNKNFDITDIKYIELA